MSDPILRILDANRNRAREALRVIEEYARFVLDDSSLTRIAKDLRHDLAAAMEGISFSGLLSARDTPGDVGTRISTPSEAARQTTADVLAAATSRLTEALRAIEEYAKPQASAVAGAVEALRYRAYELEKLILLRARPRSRFADVRLYVLITADLCLKDWLDTARDVIAGGADCLQLREKNLDSRRLLDRAKALSDLCHEAGRLFIMNDRPDIAVLAHADGVHVGQEDLSVPAARQIVGPDRLVGLSTHSLDQARAALALGPDYIGVGPMFDSQTKTQSLHAGPETLERILAEISLPHVAIGGITPDNVHHLTAVGCKAVAVCHSVLAVPDPKAATQRLKSRL